MMVALILAISFSRLSPIAGEFASVSDAQDIGTEDLKTSRFMLLVENASTADEQDIAHGRRLALVGAETCRDMKDKTGCEGLKTGCKTCRWYRNSCETFSCGAYKDETECCANVAKVDDGCYWNAKAKAGMFSKKCVPMQCNWVASNICEGKLVQDCSEAKSQCEATQGCKYADATGCKKCQKDTQTCSVSDSKCSCKEPDAVKDSADCALTKCAGCFNPFKSSSWESELKGKCKSVCGDHIHCVEEVKCLMGKFMDDGSCKLQPSCGKITHTKPVTCGEWCKWMNNNCEKCGGKNQCDGNPRPATPAPTSTSTSTSTPTPSPSPSPTTTPTPTPTGTTNSTDAANKESLADNAASASISGGVVMVGVATVLFAMKH